MKELIFHNRVKLLTGILIFSGIAMAFAQIQKTNLLKNKLQEKIEAYQLKKMAECKSDAILEAEIYIDSILHRSMNSPISDSMFFPAVPLPPFDSIQMEIDTNPVKPLLGNKIMDIQ